MILKGQPVAHQIKSNIESFLKSKSGKRPPCLAVLLAGDDLPSHTYVKKKLEACNEVGIVGKLFTFEESVSEKELLKTLDQLNKDDAVDGILVQLPLPKHISSSSVLQAVNPAKDVDGLTPLNAGKLLLSDPTGFTPCTPMGIAALIDFYGIELEGKRVLIIGRSNIVGKPLAVLLSSQGKNRNATVTLAHSKTRDLEKLILEHDILVAAIGKPRFIRGSMVKENMIIIDVGINTIILPSGKKKMVGDVHFDEVAPIARAITPVPGGVGPMTIASVLQNTLISYQRRFFEAL